MSAAILRWLALGLSIAIAIFALATLRTLSRGSAEMRASDAAFHAGRLELSVRHARRAATLYVPGSGHVAEAYERLFAVAHGAERERNVALATTAWRAVRSAALESRHLWTPRAEALSAADKNLQRLMGLTSDLSPSMGPHAPDGVWVLLLGGGFFGIGIGVVVGVQRAVTPSGQFVGLRVVWPALLIVLSMMCWGLALVRA